MFWFTRKRLVGVVRTALGETEAVVRTAGNEVHDVCAVGYRKDPGVVHYVCLRSHEAYCGEPITTVPVGLKRKRILTHGRRRSSPSLPRRSALREAGSARRAGVREERGKRQPPPAADAAPRRVDAHAHVVVVRNPLARGDRAEAQALVRPGRAVPVVIPFRFVSGIIKICQRYSIRR
jgi:hypothetical protein